LDAIRESRASGERYIVMAHARTSVVDREALFKEVRAGNPVVVFGDTSIARGLVDAQFDQPLRSIDSHGVEESESAYGLFIDRRGVQQVFQIGEKNMATAARLAYEWAAERLKEDEAGAQDVNTLAAGWTLVLQRSTFYDLNPHGKQNIFTLFYKLSNDGSTTYDWWNIEFRHESVPGKQAWGNDWRTADMWQKVWGRYNGLNYFVSDRDPTTTQGSTSVGVSVGTSAGYDGASVNASMSWSYTTSDVMINDQGDTSQARAQWYHNVNENQNVGKATYVVKPGATMRVPNGTTAPYNKWQECYQIQWMDPNFFVNNFYKHTVWWGGGTSCAF
ncbi:MAG TPA: hypothetical protein VFZ09_47880, partial [Archangium sp.]|uniref:hypothetical protein n=1 Tax=Archangium sp. TaxID=1872627 RepID=UPI002E342112